MDFYIVKRPSVNFYDSTVDTVTTKASKKCENSIDLFIDYFKDDTRYVDKYGKCTEKFKNAYTTLEKVITSKLTSSDKDKLQLFLASIGAKTNHLFQLPKESIPFWHLSLNNQFYNKHIIEDDTFDVIVVGGGLTGTSAVYHMINSGLKIALIDEQFPGAYSSGKNGGNFQLFPEFPVHISQILKDKKLTFDFFNLTKNNSLKMKNIINKLGIKCNYSEAGWLRLAYDKDEETLLIDEMRILSEIYGDNVKIVDREYIKKHYGIDTEYCGRLTTKSGNYDPIKFINAILKYCAHKINIYTGTKLLNFLEIDDCIKVTVLNNGILKHIKTKKLIFATNVFTREIIPELHDKIRCVGSQIVNLEHVENKFDGITCTKQMGKIYINFPKSTHYYDSINKKKYGMLHFGYDSDLKQNEKDPRNIVISKESYGEMTKIINKMFPDTKNQPVSRIWAGPLAFTPDNIPIISFYKTKNIVIAAGFQGFGGSFCVEAGYIASKMILEGVDVCDPKVYGYDRFSC